MRADSAEFARVSMSDAHLPVPESQMTQDDADYATLFRQYGIVLNSVQRMVSAVERGFGEARFSQDRVLRMMRNSIPTELRSVFDGLPD